MNKKNLLIILVLVLMGSGVAAGIYLVQNQQLLQKDASVPNGPAEVTISPSTMTLEAGETFTANVSFNTGGIVISSVVTKLEYTYNASSSEPPLTAIAVNPNPSLDSSPNWTFTANSSEYNNGTANIYIAAVNTAIGGFTSSGEVNLATITFRANYAGTINVTFNPTVSVINAKATSEDILLTPTSSGTYTVAGGTEPTVSPSPSPTSGASLSPTPSSTPTPTTTSGTNNPTSTPTPTTTQSTGNQVSITYPTNNSTITDTTPTFTGTAPAYSTVTISVGNQTGNVVASSTGSWSWTPSTPLTGGTHTATVTSSSGGSASVTFTISTTTGDTSLIESGTLETTILLLSLGLILIVGGAVISLKHF